MNKFVISEFTNWIVFSILLPLLAPIFIGWLVTMLVHFDTNIFLFLLKKGCYNFLGMFILLGLFQDYNTAKRVFTLFGLFIIIAGVVAQSALCISTLLPEFENQVPFEKNMMPFIIISVVSLIFSIVYKLIIIKEKYNNTIKLKHGNT